MLNQLNENGALYVAIGQSYVNEALVSVKSFKKHNPHIKAAIMTDVAKDMCLDFDIYLYSPRLPAGFGSKIYALDLTPFKNTIFLDTDTYICASLQPLFDVLAKFDIAVVPDPFRAVSYIDVEGVPETFPEPNTGVLAYRYNARTSSLFKKWLEYYDAQEYKGPGWHDQPTFRRALYESDALSLFLTPEYNARLIYPTFVCQQVKIIHGRFGNLDVIANTINSTKMPRVVTSSFRDLLYMLFMLPILRLRRKW